MQAVYLNPLTDFGFKKLFGEEPHAKTPPNLPLSGEEQEMLPPLHTSPDKGRLGGVFSAQLGRFFPFD